jgi:hypothetical protein
MRDLAFELRRIPLPRTRVNKLPRATCPEHLVNSDQWISQYVSWQVIPLVAHLC